MGRHSCCYKQKLRKGLWSPEEDEKLINHITKYGHGCWSSVPKLAGLQRCGKSCRLRWINYLRPDLKRGTFSLEEETLIVKLHSVLGNRWSQIAAQLPGRTDNEIKNLWNSSIKKKLRQQGMDPTTHKPLLEAEIDHHENGTKDIDKASSTELSFDNSGTPAGVSSSSVPPERFRLFETKPADPSSFLSFHNLDYGPNAGLSMSPSTNLFFNSNQRDSEIEHHHHTSVESPIFTGPSQIKLAGFPHVDSNPVVKFETWDSISNDTRTSTVSSTSGSMFETNVFPWAMLDYFLSGNSLLGPSVHDFQTQFPIDGSLNTANWQHQNQQQQNQSLQATEIYRAAAPFEQFS